MTGKGDKEWIVPITADRLMDELRKKEGEKGWLSLNPTTKRPYLTIRKALIRATEKSGSVNIPIITWQGTTCATRDEN